MGEHFAYLQAQLSSGVLVLAGRTQEAPYVGIAIFEADDDVSAQAFADADPAIQAGVFKLRSLQRYSVALMRSAEPN